MHSLSSNNASSDVPVVVHDNLPPSLELINTLDKVSFNWMADSARIYRQAFENIDLTKLSTELLDMTDSTCGVNQQNMDIFCDHLRDVFLDAGEVAGVMKHMRANPNPKTAPAKKARKGTQPWFDGECHQHRKDYFRIKNRLVKQRSIDESEKLKNKAKKYKAFILAKSAKFYKDLNKKIQNLKRNLAGS